MPRRAEAVHAYIATHPGVTDEELVKALHLTSRAAVAAVCRRLEEDRRIVRRKEGRIVRNFVTAETAERAGDAEEADRTALGRPAPTAVARGTDVGLVAESVAFSLPTLLAKPASFLLRVDLPPEDGLPGAFAGACVAFDGARFTVQLRAAVPDVTSTPVAAFARQLRAAAGRAAVTVRLLPGLPDRGLFPAPPREVNGPAAWRSWRRTIE